MQRPVWLFSMDSEQFRAAPTTTGGLKAYYQRYGRHAADTDIRLVHFTGGDSIQEWQQQWLDTGLAEARAALEEGLVPVAGFSCYTWNAAEFLALIRGLKESCPQLSIIAGGPHVQKVEDYLLQDPIDAIVMGEGEITFCEWLDCAAREQWHQIAGLAFSAEGRVVVGAARPRITDLDTIPSPLDVVPLCDEQGRPLYDAIAYETSRGCPFKCAFCEWGTGAIGTRMYQFSLRRIEQDWRHIVASGIANIWLADSNFGALREDLAKTELICRLKQESGLPGTFATSWSKKHSPRVQQIVLTLHEHGLLPHYQLALQTLTPLALQLSNRQNMEANKYQPIAKSMAEAGVPIAAELIWGLPGDNLADFERNLDTLLATFPNINIFGYTLLPGTEFYDKREQYRIETIPVAGYGKAKGEYVVGCHTFDRDEGVEGYFMITAHILLVHGHVIPLLTRYLALSKILPVSPLLRAVLRRLLENFAAVVPGLEREDRMAVYENRAALYLAIMARPERCFELIRETVRQWCEQHQVRERHRRHIEAIVKLDALLAPRCGPSQTEIAELDFDAPALFKSLEAMDLPGDTVFVSPLKCVEVFTPGGVGEVLKDPDGGSWLKGQLRALAIENSAEVDALCN